MYSKLCRCTSTVYMVSLNQFIINILFLFACYFLLQIKYYDYEQVSNQSNATVF